jgi:hypothetical protein
MDGKKILVPYNFTGNDQKSLDFIIQRYGQENDVEITLFHAYTPVPEINVSDKTVMHLMASNLLYLRQRIHDLEEEFGKARERLLRAGFAGDRVRCKFKPLRNDVAKDIITLAESGDFETIVLNHNPSRIKGFFTVSTSKRIVKSLPGIGVHMVV